MSQREALLKSYSKRLKDDVKSILDNFTEIVKTAKVEDESQVARLTQAVEDGYEIEVRASNIVRAGESLLRLISDIKEFLILNDFPCVNVSLQNHVQHLKTVEEETFNRLAKIRHEMDLDIRVLEEEYAFSKYK